MCLTLQELEEGRRIAALVVRHCGEKYFPLFDRFDREVQKRRSDADRIEAALRNVSVRSQLRAHGGELDF